MATITFDSLAYFDELKNAGVEEKQARVIADGLRRQAEDLRQQGEELRKIAEEMDDKKAKELATKGDLAQFQIATANEFKLLRGEMRETELRLQKEIEMVRKEIADKQYSLLVWQIGIALALAAIMAKGFNWLGF